MSFTTIRLLSGALALLLISHFSEKPAARRETRGSWISGLVLFVYAAAFSFAYVSLSAGMGALVLFGTVQITMIGIAMWRGERLGALQWAGSVAAIGGLVYLLLPGISAPDPLGALLMCVSGVAWGIYSIRGRGVKNPVAMTSGNFLRAAPLAILISAIMLSRPRRPPRSNCWFRSSPLLAEFYCCPRN